MIMNEKDILTQRKELKKSPYSVPEGYFRTFKEQMHKVTAQTGHSLWRSSAAYIAAAACTALLITFGTVMAESLRPEEEYSLEDYILFSDHLISSYYEATEQVVEVGLQDEEIIEYLIYTGISPETIELYK